MDLYHPHAWPQAKLDSAWRTLLLSQHHDCWIVPYNGKPGNTWADKVVRWTNNTNAISDSLINNTLHLHNKRGQPAAITVLNTQLHARQEDVEVRLPDDLAAKQVSIVDQYGKQVASQIITDSLHRDKVLFRADVPAFGCKTYRIVCQRPTVTRGANIRRLQSGDYQMETDLYRILVSLKHGGRITSLYDKQLKKEFVDQHDSLGFNTLRGNFWHDGGIKKSDETPAKVEVIEQGPVRIRIQISGTIDHAMWRQSVALSDHQRLIDVNLDINWQHNTRVGAPTPPGSYDWKNYHKAFYDDRDKLLAVFPLNLKRQKVYKNAPFDVTQSRLKNTFFTSWDSIKNNVLLNWVDVSDSRGQYGMALFSDHTTAYTHGEDFPLGLVVQYSGVALWGRDYTIDGPTHIRYALMQHKGKWDRARIWSSSADWNQPMAAVLANAENQTCNKPMITSASDGLVLSYAKSDGRHFSMRVFNAEGANGVKIIKPGFKFTRAIVRSLDGLQVEELKAGTSGISLDIPRFGIRTIEFTRKFD